MKKLLNFNYNFIEIGNMYLLFSFIMFFFAGIMILGVRLELIHCGVNIMPPEFFNSIVTLHGIIMIFGVIMPSFTGLFYWIIPNLIFFKKFYFNKITNFSFLLLLISSLIIIISIFLPLGFISIGWTMYTPLSIQMGYNIDLIIFSIYFLCLSSILNSINISITILKTFKINIINMSIFLWTSLVTSYLIILVMPVLIGVLTMVLLDRYLYTSFFNPCLGGDTIMYQHIFWFFGHPEVYIMILPAFGIISQVISVFSKKKIFAHNSMIYAILSIAILSLTVWGHHMFVTGISLLSQLFFMYCTLFISIPTGIKIFNWLFTIWRGSLSFTVPMLFSLGFIFFFLIGGYSGFMLAIAPLDIYYHGTYFVVAHFHYILVSSTLFSIFSAWYYWSPLLLKVKFNELNGRIHFWSSFFFLNFTFFPMHFLGFKGMPRRYIDYPIKFIFYNKIITINFLFLSFSQLYFLYNILFPIIYNYL